jgi:hypothetical protein
MLTVDDYAKIRLAHPDRRGRDAAGRHGQQGGQEK